MKCPKCQFDNPEGARFCNECGIQSPHGGRMKSERYIPYNVYKEVMGNFNRHW